ncbi:SusC/RagA family TonB-linked outer membrane protein [Myroides sp.]|uniref:SusC/RagA family TonB-linked outer membrane protein n=1 Tax=Myroides sp. TaxID=1874736 RepID=UPI003F3F248A
MKLNYKWIVATGIMLLSQNISAQQKALKGVVTEGGLPLPGVTVMIKGTDKGTQTDLNGNYTLNVQKGDVLVYSFVGMQEVTHKVGDAQVHNVTMSGDSGSELDTIVVTAYGTQSRASVAGSIATIESKDIENVVASNVTQGLVGKVAGVQIFNTSGAPGQSTVIRFRGIGSINGSSAPLIVLDGVPFNGTMNSINNSDIESVSFLKDASAAALYGNRGANGVLIITTKQGKQGGVKVTVDSKFGVANKNFREYDRITDPGMYYEAYHQALAGSYYRAGKASNRSWEESLQLASNNLVGSNGSFTTLGNGLGHNIYNVANNEIVLANGKLNPNASLRYHEDYKDFIFKNGFVSQNNVSLAGGTDNTKYYMSVGHETNDGIVKTQTFEKTTVRLNLDSKMNKTFSMGGNLSYANIVQKDPMGGGYATGGNSSYVNPFFWTNTIAPIYPVHAYNAEGKIMKDNLGNNLFDDGSGTISPYLRPFGGNSNAYAEGINNIRKNQMHQLFGSVFLNANLYEGLSFKYVLSGDMYSSLLRQTQNPLYGSGAGVNGRAYQTDDMMFAVTHQQLLNYSNGFGDHSIDLLLGHETMSRSRDDLYVQRTNMVFPDSPYIDHASAINSATGGGNDYKLEGYFARMNYGYANRYFLNASIRRDASSYFHPDHKWGTFFGVGGAWVISKESFLENVSWLDNLKLKASYGEQGNDNLGIINPYQDKWVVVPTFNADAAVILNQTFQGTKDISWEKNKNFNIGFEGSIFNGRLNVEFEYFQRKVDDMLFLVPMPVISGVASKPFNAGDMKNTGFELTLNGDIIRTNDLRVGLNFNTTHYKNEITRLPAGQERIVDGQFVREVGGSVYDFYLKEYVGFNKENGNAQFVRIDPVTGESSIVEDSNLATNQRIDKSSLPKFYGGFGLDVEYKGFDLSANFAYQLGGYGLDAKYYGFFDVRPGQNMHKDYINAWSPTNTNGSSPMLYIQDAQGAYSRSTAQLVKTDYLSLQNVTLGYNFTSSVTSKIGLDKLRIYTLVDNPLLFSKRKGYDPRLHVTGTSGTGYNLYTTVMFGVNLQF